MGEHLGQQIISFSHMEEIRNDCSKGVGGYMTSI